MKNSKSLRWWIVEDALRDRKGHWSEYLQTFRRGLEAEGDEVCIFADRECEAELAKTLGAEPVLPKSIWARMSDGAPKWRRLLRIPAHGVATYRAVSKLLAGCSALHAPLRPVGSPSQRRSSSPTRRRYEPEGALPAGRTLPDLIFVPTVLVHHLAGWVPLIKWKLRDFPGRILLFFPNAPVYLDNDGTAQIAADPTAKLFRQCIRALRREVVEGKVVLGAETEPMTRALTEATGVRFTYLPHPVELSPKFSPATRDSVGRLGDPSPQTPVSVDRQGDLVALGPSPLRSGSASPPVPATSADHIIFGCYGAARWEKGSDVLQVAIRQVLEKNPDIPARFAFQWVEDFTDDAGRTCCLDPWLERNPKVEVIRRYFGEQEYAGFLARTDVILLPYRLPYQLRVSRVLIEAMLLGLPVVATRGTTLADQAGEFGAAVLCDDGSADSLASAIIEASAEHSALQLLAEKKAQAAGRHFSIAGFRQIIAAR